VPPGLYTHSFRWEPGQVTFSTVAGSSNTDAGRVIDQHVFTSGVPSPGGNRYASLCMYFIRAQYP
jgi:hypothetical protein